MVGNLWVQSSLIVVANYHFSSRKGSLDVVDYLLKQEGCNIDVTDDFGQTPLHYAAGYVTIISVT